MLWKGGSRHAFSEEGIFGIFQLGRGEHDNSLRKKETTSPKGFFLGYKLLSSSNFSNKEKGNKQNDNHLREPGNFDPPKALDKEMNREDIFPTSIYRSLSYFVALFLGILKSSYREHS